ncbi:hypothetical protein CONPUDRAFT_139860 [Coniophora puteana RWD-64-598 SS2]|uniref:Ubiquitin-activating enzyme E1-like n=1 Tax=Coniophora puteana (strain RWD-64-598) TaxID=741705 RepID=A0A5M3MAK8_CONPW|nr:uncharacterized protein CONPUDRAFT_139860 [Coniophora puteana RWD-64-598 SS2]EIW75894.1 hypothetical protein CONPUDRAFT_139860 [Coniophora puteana RWD-64-598 SS2]
MVGSSPHKNPGRYRHAEAILGKDLVDRLADTKVLLVGAGGIGCELLKNIVLTGFGHITLLDLDTIDLSNLNRQFLFKKKDVKQSKALVAAATAGPFNPNAHIYPIHGNIKEPQFDIEWFKGFDIVLNALDNLDARRHVNKMCMAAGVPLIESGTAGYLGQVQPLVKDRTECFDCVAKPTPKSFPVCTIRSTPSQPIHCIVWAKSYLLPQLFGEDEDGSELDEAEKHGENAQEIATLRKEALAYKAVRKALRSPATSADAARMAFQKVFNTDILNLLSMSDMWRTRPKPTPLDFDLIQNGAFSFLTQPAAAGSSASFTGSHALANGVADLSVDDSSSIAGTSAAAGSTGADGSTSAPANGGGGLKDQRRLSLQDNLAMFIGSADRLAARLRAGEDTIGFDKDDDDTLDFVTASANLRAFAYGIGRKTRWEVKEMAGNIIPAIATTNAIVAGVIVLQALHVLRRAWKDLRNVHLQFKPAVPLSTIRMCAPNPRCGVCRDMYVCVRVDPARVTLRELVEGILGDGERESQSSEDGDGGKGGTGPRDVSVYEDKRVLADPDWEDNMDRTLESLGAGRGKFVTIVDEEEQVGTVAVGLAALPPNHPQDAPALILPSPLPVPPKFIKLPPVTPASPEKTPAQALAGTSLKRRAPTDDDGIIAIDDEGSGPPDAKRVKVGGGPNGHGHAHVHTHGRSAGNGNRKARAAGAPEAGQESPSKRRRLEEDGLVLLEGAGGRMVDDVIEIE